MPLVITTPELLPPATVDEHYAFQLQADGGTLPYAWSPDSEAPLPKGLTLTPGGLITGSPATPGPATALVRVQDSSDPDPQCDSAYLTLVLYAPLELVTGSPLPTGGVGSWYQAALEATGGSGGNVWYVATGSALPGGLGLDPGSGVISGTPTSPKDDPFTFTIGVRDEGGAKIERTFGIEIYQ